ncbi:MAG TPA: hypothetical protein VHZ53_00180 [Steroidobacteraceae bacterium]|nr:hypothetical protein [Steroidobacteraceae bacterium]
MARYHLAGVAVQGPADADRYLTENYGDWRVPVKTFSATTGTPNLRLVSNLFSPALFLKRMLYHAGRGEAEGRKIEAQMLRSGCLKREDARLVFDPAFLQTRSRQPAE